MKQFVLFLLVVIVIVCVISYIYINYQIKDNKAKKENFKFENYIKNEISGTDVTTLINKAIDNNEINEVKKDDKGNYLDDNKNSILIEVKINDNDKIYKMETLYNRGMQSFVEFYGSEKFKCNAIEYHNSTNKIKYILFEQII